MATQLNRTRTIFFTTRLSFRFTVALLLAVAFFAFISGLLSRQFKASMIEVRKLELVRLVTLGYHAIEPALSAYARGHITKEESLGRVRDTVRRLVYDDPSSQNYLFMSTYEGTMLVQPFEPFKEGSNQWNLKDSDGVYIIRELVAKAKEGKGFVVYKYPPPGSSKPQIKMSYVVGIPLLGCYIGTGMYLEDIHTIIDRYSHTTILFIFLIMLGLVAFCILLLYPVVKIYRILYNRFSSIAQAPETFAEPVPLSSFRAGSEAYMLLDGFQEMLQKIQEYERNLNALSKSIEGEVAERIHTADLLRQKTHELELIIENLPAYVFLKDRNGMYISANKKLCQLLGMSLDELCGKTDYDIYPPETADRYVACDRKVMEERRPIASGEEDHEEGGRRIYTISRKVPLIDESGTVKGIIGLAFDVTELKEAQEKLAVSLHEKEMLFKEVHHRVKNNMQIISSLLNLQGYQMSSERDRELLMASINRIQSMSMVHEMLYQSGNISRIELSLYMKNLVSYIFSMYAVSSELITVEWGRMDDIDVNIDAGINCGLIVTEIVTNSIKYAFPERRKGSIQVGLRAEDEALILGIGDNGIGMREDILKGERSSLGLSLVESLVAQMEGSLNISSEGGTSYKISFPLSLVKASGI